MLHSEVAKRLKYGIVTRIEWNQHDSDDVALRWPFKISDYQHQYVHIQILDIDSALIWWYRSTWQIELAATWRSLILGIILKSLGLRWSNSWWSHELKLQFSSSDPYYRSRISIGIDLCFTFSQRWQGSGRPLEQWFSARVQQTVNYAADLRGHAARDQLRLLLVTSRRL